MIPEKKYFKTLPRKPMGSAVLFTNGRGKVLLVKLTYKDHWTLPGGVVSAGESPREAAIREVEEELSLTVKKIQFLCVDYAPEAAPKPESLQFIFDGGKLTKADVKKIVLQESELSEFKFVSIEEAKELVFNTKYYSSASERINSIKSSLKTGKPIYLENGKQP